jgi:hypothetical protein
MEDRSQANIEARLNEFNTFVESELAKADGQSEIGGEV